MNDKEILLLQSDRSRKGWKYFFFIGIGLGFLFVALLSIIVLHNYVLQPQKSVILLVKEGSHHVEPTSPSFGLQFEDENYVMDAEDNEVKNVNEEGKVGKQCGGITDDWRFDCHPEDGATQAKCEARGCCWAVPTKKAPSTPGSIGIPYCFYPTDYPSYYLLNSTETKNGFIAYIERNTSSYYPNDIKLLRLDFIAYSNTLMRLKIYDPSNKRYEVPYPLNLPNVSTNAKSKFLFHFDSNPFGIKIIHKETKRTVFQSAPAPFIFTDQYIQYSGMINKYLYGLGERRDRLLRSTDWQRFVMLAEDQAPLSFLNLYGSHPFFMSMTETRFSNGVLFYNSNAMEVVTQPATALTLRTTGGIIDLISITAEQPADVIKSYISIIGLPAMPPLWALGFHLCRFGLKSDEETRKLWQRTRDANIPFDVQWNDIDYMDNRRDFTYDKKNYSGLPALVDDIHKADMRYVVITDPALDTPANPSDYPPYEEALKKGILINDTNGKPFVGKVWSPSGAVWPDFTNPATTDYWTKQIKSFHDQIPVDGLWIDMNEPSNFYDGTKSGCPSSTYETPPYVPHVNGGKLSHKTVCMTAKQHAGLHYNVHNLYGYSETIATNKALRSVLPGKRPFIISRSTFPGQGHYGGHWTGDVFSTWSDLKYSIPAILDANMFGIPLVGADICGFNGNTTVELCTRWMELGAFYPFSRNHNSDDCIDQDPVALGQQVVEASKSALTLRYTFLPVLYTLFYRAHVYGETVARPLFFEFYTDVNTFNIDTQFMWGSSIMILPILEQGQTTLKAYFPKGKWIYSNNTINSAGEFKLCYIDIQSIGIAYREGSILPLKLTTELPKTTVNTRKFPFLLSVFQNATGQASGELFWDDGESLGTIKSGAYNLISFYAEPNVVGSNVIKAGASSELQPLEVIQVLDIKIKPTKVLINGVSAQFTIHNNGNIKVLVVGPLNVNLAEPFKMTWQ